MIVCIRTGELYSLEYVERLFQHDPEIVCYTDNPVLWCDKKLPIDDKGWWAKLWLFSGAIPFPFLYLDLDIIIHKPLDAFRSDRLTGIHDFAPDGQRRSVVNTSVIWMTDGYQYVWDLFEQYRESVMGQYPTEQHWLQTLNLPWVYYPDEWTRSYKWGKQAPETKITVFHGKPKPHEVDWNV